MGLRSCRCFALRLPAFRKSLLHSARRGEDTSAHYATSCVVRRKAVVPTAQPRGRASSGKASSAVQQALRALLFACRTASFVAVCAAISTLFFRLAERLMKSYFSITFSHLSVFPYFSFYWVSFFVFPFFLLSRLLILFCSIAYFSWNCVLF